ncbi:hypothetical protein ARSQ2_00845 [Arsenophonus endosymbiont of Bemisia tabaci Q2]|nr:hypothetical protein ARSQ2_00845 [Arsenophonus endosymbiont of Bemisia tabaci Q2]
MREGRLFDAIALLEGNKPLARIVGWQSDFRKLDPQSYAVYKAKFPEIDKIPLIGNTSAENVSAEKVLTLNPDIPIFGLSGHGPGKNSELVMQLEKAFLPVVFVDFRSEPLKNTLPSIRLLGITKRLNFDYTILSAKKISVSHPSALFLHLACAHLCSIGLKSGE